MKKTVRWFSALLTICMFFSMLTVSAFAAPLRYTDDYGTWDYEVENDGSITIVGFEAAKKNIVVPTTIDGQNVRKLGDGLFKGNLGLCMVIVPLGVREIGNEVFCGCDRLEEVRLPSSLEKIGDSAFADCALLESLYVPASVVQLGTKVFEDCPNIEVKCDLNSAAAEYLLANRSEVANFTLVHYEAQTPAQPGNPPTNNGELVTYSFGKLIDGQPEYTLELVDLKPDTELMNFLVQKGDQVFFYNNDQAEAAMDNRFQVISLKKFDGQKTTSYSQQDPSNISVRQWIEDFRDASAYKKDINYSIFFNELAYGRDIPGSVTFNSKNELLTYTEYSQTSDNTTYKQDSSLYVRYSQLQRTETVYFADGGDSTDSTGNGIIAHIIPVEGHCSEIRITNTVIQPSNMNIATKEAVIYADNDTEIRASSSSEMVSGKRTYAEGGYYVFDNGQMVEDKYSQMVEDKYIYITFDDNEVLASFDLSQNGSGEKSGVFESTQTVFNTKQEHDETRFQDNAKFEQTVTVNNSVFYRERVGEADNLTDFEEDLFNYFPNDADENANMVSDRVVQCVDTRTVQGTQTNLADNSTSTYTYATSSESLSDHTYVGDTGKYVGWDWLWSYNLYNDNATKVLNHYSVTEYKYDTATDTWNKTVAQVSAKNNATPTAVDFKTTFPTPTTLPADYTLRLNKFVYDESLPGGANNWRPDNSQPGQPNNIESEVMNLVSGNTGLTDGDGNTMQQTDVKKDMLALEDKVKQDIAKGDQKDIPEQFVDDAVDQLPSGIDGDAIMDTVENASNGTQPLPEDNTQGELLHEHDEN